MTRLTEEQLRQCSVFANASEHTINNLIGNFNLIAINKKKEILGQADTSTDVYLIVDGIVRIKTFSKKGKDVSYGDIKPGDLFGEFSAIDNAPRSAAILAITKAVVAKLSAVNFRNIVMSDPEVSMALIKLQVAKNRELTGKVQELATLNVGPRIQTELERQAEAVGGKDAVSVNFNIPIQDEIAARVGTHREAVTKELGLLETLGLIKRKNRNVTIEDFQKFRKLAGEIHLQG